LQKTKTKQNKSAYFKYAELRGRKYRIRNYYYFSIRKAAKAIKSDIKPILRREKQQIEKGENTPYKNRYIIYIKRENNHT
jgi:hypothetical protein